MSDTPRTDEQVKATARTIKLIGCASDGGVGDVDAVTAEFARQLERELAEEREKNEQKLLKAMEFGAQSVRSSTRRRYDCQTGTADVCLAAKLDGIVCPSDSCDIDNGVRSIPHALSGRLESVAKTLDTEGYTAGAEWVREAVTALSATGPTGRAWQCPADTVGKLIDNLRTLPPEMAFHTAYFVEIDGKRVAKTTTASMSRETVFDHRIQKYDAERPSLVIWASSAPTDGGNKTNG